MKYELEERTCKCGCGYKFKVLPTSKQEYAAKHHDPDFNQPGYVKFEGPTVVSEKIPAMPRDDLF